MSVQRLPLWPIGLLFISITSIQGGAALAKQLFPLIGAPGTTAIRLLMAAAMLLLVLRPWRRPISARVWKAMMIYGVALGCMNYMLYQAIERIPLGIAVALEFTGPLAVAILSSRRWLDALWVGLALVGIVMIMPHSGVDHDLDLVGVAFALGAGVCWALYIWFGQRIGTDLGPEGTAIGVTIAALVIAPLGIYQSGPGMFSLEVLPLAALVAIMSTALPYSLEMIALKHLPTTTFGTLMSLEPAVAALSGLLFLGELLTLVQWLAIVSIMVASIGTTLTHRPADQAWEAAPAPD
ncbi:EamA family transporter [Larsenimonas rhizosphaerae]|uniref:EamA family transporter n=1 Tax=Larsenimonas rhizosphaerae TaxID=2944682 RepID=A0AA41ZIC7_9GAMM|nr:EamA family transporter [Larsenimonas rhizosphaerae]MCM2131353.1 EamA family transporter [Larsenimonas rhizosphaerae]MCX2525282.1 EamA family transporter [Larsenimonas rhizosphaerae]